MKNLDSALKNDMENRSDFIIGEYFGKGRNLIMTWLTNELLFYGGIAVAVFSIAVLIIGLCILKMKRIRLNAQMDKEYGEQKKVGKR